MTKILLVADTTAVLARSHRRLDDGEREVRELARTGRPSAPSTAEFEPDLVITDSQVQNMGGFAIAFDLANEESGGTARRTCRSSSFSTAGPTSSSPGAPASRATS